MILKYDFRLGLGIYAGMAVLGAICALFLSETKGKALK